MYTSFCTLKVSLVVIVLANVMPVAWGERSWNSGGADSRPQLTTNESSNTSERPSGRVPWPSTRCMDTKLTRTDEAGYRSRHVFVASFHCDGRVRGGDRCRDRPQRPRGGWRSERERNHSPERSRARERDRLRAS